MGIIKAIKLGFDYIKYGEDEKDNEKIRAIDGIDIDVEKGSVIAILGHNGSGKSTLAKHMNALLQKAGMVFQNPDNQIVASVVEEDVGFGPENIGVPTKEIWERVDQALERVGMTKHRKKSPNRLSGGQKQRVAIAGVVAMRPDCIVLDESTAMLDPNGRKDVLDTVMDLNRQEGVTVIMITHYMEEVTRADYVYVMDSGKIVMQGTPREIFSQVEKLKSYHLDVPQITELAYELKKDGVDLPDGILTREELVGALCGEPTEE